MTWTAEKLVRETGSVSSLPSVCEKLNNAVNDPTCSSNKIAKIISDDAALAARLLKIANSAMYGFPSKIDGVNRAVTIIGTKQLCDLAYATSVLQMFKGIPDDVVNMKSFWLHSVACGLIARILATFLREKNVERYFVAGLLHDIGKLIIFVKLADESKNVFDYSQKNSALGYDSENNVLGFNHAEVGGALLKQWKLPESTAEAVRLHHRPSVSEQYRVEASCIHVADLIANSLQIGSSGERFTPKLDEKAWENLGLSEVVLSQVLKQFEWQFNDVLEFILPEGT